MTRVLSAATLLAVLIAAVWVGPLWATLALGVLAAAIGAHELVAMAGVRVRVVSIGAAITTGTVTAAFAYGDPLLADPHQHSTMLVAVLVAVVVLTGVSVLASGDPVREAVPVVGLAFMAPLYVGLPVGVLVWVQAVYGREAFLLPIAIVAASDTAQYYTGRAFGRRKLAPTVSPAKTIEGAIGGLVVSGLLGVVLAPYLLGVAVTPVERVPMLVGAGFGVLLGLAGMLGDLFESFLKRSAGVKDSSGIIPGHGGVLDRIDSHLFAAPVYYLLLRCLT
jgi:phosphatidate cytidylyltransferase